MNPGSVDRVEIGLRAQASVCAEYGSTFYGVLLEAAAREYRTGGPLRAFFEADPSRRELSRFGIRLAGALQYRALDGSAPGLAAHFPSCGGDGDAEAAWRAASALLAQEPEQLSTLYLRTPQTNEVGRAMPLLAGLLAISDAVRLPVALLDVGTSAGLNLRLDRFRYEGEGWSWGDAASPLVLRNAIVSGRPAHLDVRPHVASRAGCDLHPLDVTRERDRLELRSFLWPDQRERFERLDAAIAVACSVPAELEASDFLDWIPRRAVAREGVATVVMHSVVTEHLSPEVGVRMREAIESAAATARANAPVAWLRMEPDDDFSYETRVTIWPSGTQRTIARSDGHGQSIAWIEA